MGAPAPPNVASWVASTQVTPSQALEILDEMDIFPETDMFVSGSYPGINADESVVESVEATQPPTLSPYTPYLPQSYFGDITVNPNPGILHTCR